MTPGLMASSRGALAPKDLACSTGTTAKSKTLASPALERVQPGHRRANDQGVNIVRALVGLHRLQIGHVAEDGVLIGNAVGAQDVAGHAGALQRHPHIISLGHGNVLMPAALLIL